MATIKLADPNIVNNSLNNGTPDYSRMFIFVDLTATRRENTVITSSGKNSSINTFDNNTSISLMGYDKETGSYTTKWTNNVGGEQTPYEGFGINNIEIEINSSYVPQINIEFIDVRGLSLFNEGGNSPYSVLHSFPPPLFDLSIKGFYGKALKYELHLVKHNTKFDASSGNYIINVEYVASTFAPLSDILLKYVEIAKIMNVNEGSVDTSTITPPKNLNDFIKKSKRLYDNITDIKENSKEIKDLNDVNDKIRQLQNLKKVINDFPIGITSSSEISNFTNGSGIFLVPNDQKSPLPTSYAEPKIINFDIKNPTKPLYDPILFGDKGNVEETVQFIRNSLQYFDDKIKSNGGLVETTGVNLVLGIQYNDNNKSTVLNIQNEIKSSLINEGGSVIPKIGKNGNSIDLIEFDFENKKYIGLDITKYYNIIYVELNQNLLNLENLNNSVKSVVDKTLRQNLGVDENGNTFEPTIRNIFRLILNDVDDFVNQLRSVGKQAEDNYKANDAIFRSKFNKTIKESVDIGAFPLYIGRADYSSKNSVNSFNKNVRKYLGEIRQDGINFPLPEVNFVESYIDAFILNRRVDQSVDLLTEEDSNGNRKWFPISPFDSAFSGIDNVQSPYFGVKNINEIYKKLYDRFIALSQYVYFSSFYSDDPKSPISVMGLVEIPISWNGGKIKKSELIKFLAKAEANNIANSMLASEIKLINQLKTNVENYSKTGGINEFYKRLRELNIKLDNSDTLYVNGFKIFADKNFEDDDNRQIDFDISKITERTQPTSDDTELIDNFLENGISKGISEFFFDRNDKVKTFTKENVVLFKDRDYNEIYETDYFANSSDKSLINNFASIILFEKEPLLKILNNSNYDNFAKAYLICSFFGNMDLLNKDTAYWGYPSVIELPYSVILFLGSIVYYFRTGSTHNQEIIDFMNYVESVTNSGDNLINYNFEYASKISERLLKNISIIDRDKLENEFINFVNTSGKYDTVFSTLINIINSVDLLSDISDEKEKLVNNLSSTDSRNNLFDILMIKYMIKIFGERPYNITQDGTKFIDIDVVNSISERINNSNNQYFIELFKELANKLDEIKETSTKIENEIQSSLDDNDIKNQLYYSFKSIYDKWIVSNANIFDSGKLIDKFIFVDRAFNDIGDIAMIDFQPLIDSSENYDEAIYSTIARLLSHNGFDFFPLQNFMTFKNDDEWKNVFETVDSTLIDTSPTFVCMYIGGSSSVLNDPFSFYKDDGIQNLETLDNGEVIDFISNTSNDPKFQPRAFKVAFSQQNQSFFTNIQLDTITHQSTNESLQILSKIAGDEGASKPIGKAQNLFETYENRSYTCTVTMLGNAMIQPTQYFQLENIPMFSGGYLITKVNHTIRSNNFMETTFTGTRIPKYPVPIVTDFITKTGILNGATSDSNQVNDKTNTVNGNTNGGNYSGDFKINNFVIPDSADELLISPNEE